MENCPVEGLSIYNKMDTKTLMLVQGTVVFSMLGMRDSSEGVRRDKSRGRGRSGSFRALGTYLDC